MLFTWDINIPKSTLEANPTIQTLQLAHGIITWVSVLFPPGCARLAHCTIWHGGHQIFPSTEMMNLSGDTFPIEWAEYYEFYGRPHELIAKLWNEDDTYPHKVTIRMAILPRKALAPASISDAIKGVFGMLSPKRIFTGGE
ncbi:unnamed protein product [marine sediment metagenome]|uniref:Uncharacterized protein n=1 Tax=marine sediment metagenome TaxID=412755 RepID=X1JMY3_9ZZZZ